MCGDYLLRSVPQPEAARFIPTCVGTTPATPGGLLRQDGSSPRVWGLRLCVLTYCARVRFIPTCVGTTHLELAPIEAGSVHPHVCGDYRSVAWPGMSKFGSSPRVWGLPPPGPAAVASPRFIPTCVGTTALAVRLVALEAGSSPRVWGLRVPGAAGGAGVRFIPTCVGTTSRPGRACCDRTVHPHVCGDYVWAGGAVHAWRRFIPTCVGTT